MIAFLTGLAAGSLHVFSGVDHLAALAPIALRDPSDAMRTGSLWGLGHGIGVVIVGAVGLWLRSFVDVEAWAAWAEFVVGILLIGVGVWAVGRARGVEIHAHPHEHERDETEHAHLHAHGSRSQAHRHAALGVGIFHGVAGSGHVFGVIPALALPVGEAVTYLGAYLAAAVAAMAGFAGLLGAVVRRGGTGSLRRVMLGSGLLAIVVGVVWMVGSWPV